MTGGPRSAPARIGICALNLLAPGLGLLRLGQRSIAVRFLLAIPVAYLLLLLFYAAAPQLNFTGYAASIGLVLLVTVGSILAAMVLSWRRSRTRLEAGGWSRWYAVVAVWVGFLIVITVLAQTAHRFYKPFYIPSEAMMPTLLKNDRLVGGMGPVRDLLRGDIILFRMPGGTYIKRVAALPGDRIALRQGIVILNGKPVAQAPVRTEDVADAMPGLSGLRLREQFPGEAVPHEIYDLGYTPADDMAETGIPEGHVFVLGDNRDRSADSRIPRLEMGVELLPVRDIQGIALFHTWGPSGKMGEKLNR